MSSEIMVFRVSHPKIELELQLYEIEKLHIHEEIITESAEKLIKTFKDDEYAKHPILVDKETLVVLDGTHRIWAFKHAGYKLIPVCFMDYKNPNIIVKSWFRTITKRQETSKNVIIDIKDLGYTLRETSKDELQTRIDKNKCTICIITLKKCYIVFGTSRRIKETYEDIKQLEKNLESIGYKIGYETRDDAIRKVKAGKILAAITTPRVRKQEIVDIALAGEVFVHKATRHVIPARPLFVNVPFKWMNLEPKEANNRLVRYLSERKLKLLPTGRTLDRRYEEELYVFE
jgi:disulfide oxidoreductase YuzD